MCEERDYGTNANVTSCHLWDFYYLTKLSCVKTWQGTVAALFMLMIPPHLAPMGVFLCLTGIDSGKETPRLRHRDNRGVGGEKKTAGAKFLWNSCNRS